MKMKPFILKPNIDLYPGIKVDKDTEFVHQGENVTQILKNLVFHSVQMVKGENYEGMYDTTIRLKEGDILIFDDGKYVKPVESFVSISEAIEDLENIKDLGDRDVYN